MKKALLVVDMQKGFRKPSKRAINCFEELLGNVGELIDFCRNEKIPIFYFKYFKHERKKGEIGFKRDLKRYGRIGDSIFQRGSDACEIPLEIKPEKGDTVIDKNEFSCFFNTGLHDILKKRDIEEVVICGLKTNYCVLATVCDAFQHGYFVTLIKDCCGAKKDESHQNALGLMKNWKSLIKVETLDDFKNSIKNKEKR